MPKQNFLHKVSDIRGIDKDGLELLLSHEDFEQSDGALFFKYRHGMNRGLRRIVVNEEGVFWIGKEYLPYNLVFELFGSQISRFLGSSSPEVDYGTMDKEPYIFSSLVFPSEPASIEDMREKGQVVLVPRLLASKVKVLNGFYLKEIKDENIPFNKMLLDIDMNRGNFPVDEDGHLHQIDFSLSEDIYCIEIFKTLSRLKGILDYYGITPDATNGIISEQLKKLRQYKPAEVVDSFTHRARSVHPRTTKQYRHNFLWTYRNIEHILQSLIDSKKPNYKIILHN